MAEDARISRRDVIKKAAYLTPAVVTLLVAPSFASSGSDAPTLPPARGAHLVFSNATKTGTPTSPWNPNGTVITSTINTRTRTISTIKIKTITKNTTEQLEARTKTVGRVSLEDVPYRTLRDRLWNSHQLSPFTGPILDRKRLQLVQKTCPRSPFNIRDHFRSRFGPAFDPKRVGRWTSTTPSHRNRR